VQVYPKNTSLPGWAGLGNVIAVNNRGGFYAEQNKMNNKEKAAWLN